MVKLYLNVILADCPIPHSIHQQGRMGSWVPTVDDKRRSWNCLEASLANFQLGGFRFQNIGDISCDSHVSDCDLDLAGRIIHDYYLGRSAIPHAFNHPFKTVRQVPPRRPPSTPAHVQMVAVNILPASIPLDSFEHVSNALLPYLSTLIDSTLSGKLSSDQYLDALGRATIASGGESTPNRGNGYETMEGRN